METVVSTRVRLANGVFQTLTDRSSKFSELQLTRPQQKTSCQEKCFGQCNLKSDHFSYSQVTRSATRFCDVRRRTTLLSRSNRADDPRRVCLELSPFWTRVLPLVIRERHPNCSVLTLELTPCDNCYLWQILSDLEKKLVLLLTKRLLISASFVHDVTELEISICFWQSLVEVPVTASSLSPCIRRDCGRHVDFGVSRSESQKIRRWPDVGIHEKTQTKRGKERLPRSTSCEHWGDTRTQMESFSLHWTNTFSSCLHLCWGQWTGMWSKGVFFFLSERFSIFLLKFWCCVFLRTVVHLVPARTQRRQRDTFVEVWGRSFFGCTHCWSATADFKLLIWSFCALVDILVFSRNVPHLIK